jgi:carbamoyl-phosphate synthase large subunit
MAGEKLADFNLNAMATGTHVAVKEAVFPFNRFPGVDVMLGPEMKSTGEVMGIDADFGRAFAKAQLGAGVNLPLEGTVFISVRDSDKAALEPLARQLVDMNFRILATRGTAREFQAAGIDVTIVKKVLEGQPHIVDAMIDGSVDLVLNTTEGKKAIEDSFGLRRTALMRSIPYFTTVAGARAAVTAIKALKQGPLEVAPLQSYFNTSF